MELIPPAYTEDDVNISEYLDIDPSDENAGEVDGIPVFFNGDSWVAAPGAEEELEEFLDNIR